jgi:iron(II)-dependent oxidoreductase
MAVALPALKARIAAELDEARRRTLDLVAPVGDADLCKQHSELMSPIVWDLAHIGYFEELWLVRRLAGEQPLDPQVDDLYDAFQHPRREREALPLPTTEDALAFLERIRERSLAVLDEIELDRTDRLLADGYVYGMVIQHEHQHCETILATLQLREEGTYPLDMSRGQTPGHVPEGPDEIRVEGGAFVLGTSDEPWAYDNEREAHDVELPAFRIDAAPVSNVAFLEFVEDGGYDDERVWSTKGWRRRCEGDLEQPAFWRREGDGSWSRVRFGHTEPLPPEEPVQHVSWYEADAFARWAGKRLPTEAEWEKAATWPDGTKLEPTSEDNLGQRRLGPAPAGGEGPRGCRGLLGDVWEWTASDFGAYPGFQPFPYSEYSEVFFGPEYKVLRGGSWATAPIVARPTFRNWDFPIRRQIFAGFRCARDE